MNSKKKVKYYSEQPYVKEQIAGLAFDNAYYNLVLGGYVNADTSQIINNDLVTYNEKKTHIQSKLLWIA